ncbi:GtrA family protein [Humisphaera borealis]|uniref:GtrA family protein n=1 Tax=Humisphaera borealis TaxID=2807512 RepID=A0A7M2WUH3_9BACT|nr:GtrA family protein [Humisphaera borealis]QOV88451.1 GtrA family protein [Humisphaera borealis]
MSDQHATSVKAETHNRFASVLTASAIVGIVASIVDYGVLLLAVWLGMAERWAIIPACVAGIVVQFFGNQRFAFKAHTHGDRGAFGRQVWRFLLVEALTLLLNAVVYNLLREAAGIDYRWARLIAAFGVYMLFSLPMWHWVFAKPKSEASVDLRSDR